MAKILFVTKWTSSSGDTVCEAYYNSDRFYLYHGNDGIPKTVRSFIGDAKNVNNVWNKIHRRRETIYK